VVHDRVAALRHGQVAQRDCVLIDILIGVTVVADAVADALVRVTVDVMACSMADPMDQALADMLDRGSDGDWNHELFSVGL